MHVVTSRSAWREHGVTGRKPSRDSSIASAASIPSWFASIASVTGVVAAGLASIQRAGICCVVGRHTPLRQASGDAGTTVR